MRQLFGAETKRRPLFGQPRLNGNAVIGELRAKTPIDQCMADAYGGPIEDGIARPGVLNRAHRAKSQTAGRGRMGMTVGPSVGTRFHPFANQAIDCHIDGIHLTGRFIGFQRQNCQRGERRRDLLTLALGS